MSRMTTAIAPRLVLTGLEWVAVVALLAYSPTAAMLKPLSAN
jgi:hypothetical protein